jgi:hypothetical protein
VIGSRRCRRLLSLPPLAALALATVGASARADELKFDLSGKLQSDLRFRIEDKSVGSFYDKVDAPVGLERNQDLLSVKFKATYGKFSGVAAVDLYMNAVGNAKVQAFGDLQNYAAVAPFSFEPQQVYLQGRNLFFKGLDLTVGNQIILWGVADQFNPTNNLNADDLRDPLLFGKQQPNFMVKADYWITKNLSMSAVLVPLFKPALLPASSVLGAADIQRMPFVDDAFRNRIEAQFGYAASTQVGYPTIVNSLTPVLPGPSMDNMQFSYRVAASLGEQDLAFSYYVGRTDFPQAFSNHTKEVDYVNANTGVGGRCDPAAPKSCINGVLATDVLLTYPRMQVFGLNLSGEFNPFKLISDAIHGVGYRVEAALIVPQRTTLQLTQSPLPAVLQMGGEYDYQGTGQPGGNPPAVVESTPFLKWTLGLDYTFGAHVYLNAQWVHGLVDEFGAGDWMHPGWSVRQSGVSTSGALTNSLCVIPKNGTQCATETMLPRLGDYLVLGADFKFLEDAGLLRVFTIWDLSGVTTSQCVGPDPTKPCSATNMGAQVQTFHSLFSTEGFSASIYPELDYNFGNGLELGAGALLLLGGSWTKFGDPAAGGSLVFTRGRFSF